MESVLTSSWCYWANSYCLNSAFLLIKSQTSQRVLLSMWLSRLSEPVRLVRPHLAFNPFGKHLTSSVHNIATKLVYSTFVVSTFSWLLQVGGVNAQHIHTCAILDGGMAFNTTARVPYHIEFASNGPDYSPATSESAHILMRQSNSYWVLFATH